MKTRFLNFMALMAFLVSTWGCEAPNSNPGNANSSSEPQVSSHTPAQNPSENQESNQKEIDASIALLPAEDQALAKAQGYCVVTEEPLGSMGMPIKLTVNNESVFICCKGCSRKALADPDKTLAKATDLKARVSQQSK